MRLRIVQFMLIVALCCSGCDRPLTFDAQGVAHGSGERVYSYKSGGPKLREDYMDGKIVRSRWFKPDGTLIQETRWANGTGEGIYLREDGSIRRRVQYVNGVAEGEAKEYDESGNMTKIMHYHAGKPVTEPEVPATQPAA